MENWIFNSLPITVLKKVTEPLFSTNKCNKYLDAEYDGLRKKRDKFVPFNMRKRRRWSKEVEPIDIYTYRSIKNSKCRKNNKHVVYAVGSNDEEWLMEIGTVCT